MSGDLRSPNNKLAVLRKNHTNSGPRDGPKTRHLTAKLGASGAYEARTTDAIDITRAPRTNSQRMMFKVAPSHFPVAARPGRPRKLISVMTVVRWLFLFLYVRVNFFEGVCNLVEKQ